jgi:hypothetical protein
MAGSAKVGPKVAAANTPSRFAGTGAVAAAVCAKLAETNTAVKTKIITIRLFMSSSSRQFQYEYTAS